MICDLWPHMWCVLLCEMSCIAIYGGMMSFVTMIWICSTSFCDPTYVASHDAWICSLSLFKELHQKRRRASSTKKDKKEFHKKRGKKKFHQKTKKKIPPKKKRKSSNKKEKEGFPPDTCNSPGLPRPHSASGVSKSDDYHNNYILSTNYHHN